MFLLPGAGLFHSKQTKNASKQSKNGESLIKNHFTPDPQTISGAFYRGQNTYIIKNGPLIIKNPIILSKTTNLLSIIQLYYQIAKILPSTWHPVPKCEFTEGRQPEHQAG
jgi:hypothetical protein